MSDKPLISVIVPVYKVERYLPRCIESILGQTYTNFELILVDDGTPDRSGIICDRYAEKDSRIRVIHKENGGVSTARNAGIDVAKGEWITFVDSDDWIDSSYLDVLYMPLTHNQFDMTSGLLEYRNVKRFSLKCNDCSINVADIDSMDKFNLVDRMEFIVPCLKLFSKKLIEQYKLRFIEGIAMGEDAIFVKNYLKYCKKIYSVGKVIYFYNKLNESSVTHQKRDFEDRKVWDGKHLKAYQEMLDSWNIKTELAESILSVKSVMLFVIHAERYILFNSREDAIKKLLDILPYYNKYISIDPQHFHNEKQRNLAVYMQSEAAAAIYDTLKPNQGVLFYKKIKQKAKNIIRPFIEKYRDGLVKFKF